MSNTRYIVIYERQDDGSMLYAVVDTWQHKTLKLYDSLPKARMSVRELNA
jgi:hypothetical protein